MAIALWTALGLYAGIGVLYAWLGRRAARMMLATPAMRRQQLAQLARRRRRPILLGTRDWLVRQVVKARLFVWWPATVALGIATYSRTPAIIIAKARVRSVDVIDGTLQLVGVGAMVAASTATRKPLPLALGTVLFLVVISLRALRILILGTYYFDAERARPGHTYARFVFGALSDTACLIGLSFVVTGIDGGLPLVLSRELVIDVPVAMLPHEVVGDFLHSSGQSGLRIAVNVAALLTYFVILGQVLRAYRFRRNATDYLNIAYSYVRLGEYEHARRFIKLAGSTPVAARFRIMIDIGTGRLDRAWEAEAQYARVIELTPDADLVWENLYLFTKDIPVSQEVRLRLFALGVNRGVSDGTLAMALDLSLSTGFDPRGVESALLAEGVRMDHLPVTRAAARFYTGDLDAGRSLLAESSYPANDWTGHVAALMHGWYLLQGAKERSGTAGAIASQAMRHASFNLAADALIGRLAVADLTILNPVQRMYLASNLGMLYHLATELHPGRAPEIKPLIAELIQGMSVTVDDVISNQRSILSVMPHTTSDLALAIEQDDNETTRIGTKAITSASQSPPY